VVVDVRALASDALRFERKRAENGRVPRIHEAPLDYVADAAHHALRGLDRAAHRRQPWNHPERSGARERACARCARAPPRRHK